MKKFLCCFLCCLLAIIFVGCANSEPLSVSFVDITGAGSTDITFVANFAEEKEYKQNHADLLIMGQVDNLVLDIAKQNQNFVTIVLPNKDVWYSLTALMYAGLGKQGQEQYSLYKDVSSLTYIIRSGIDTNIKLKAAVGTIEQSAQNGELLVFRQDASKEFELELKKIWQKISLFVWKKS